MASVVALSSGTSRVAVRLLRTSPASSVYAYQQAGVTARGLRYLNEKEGITVHPRWGPAIIFIRALTVPAPSRGRGWGGGPTEERNRPVGRISV